MHTPIATDSTASDKNIKLSSLLFFLTSFVILVLCTIMLIQLWQLAAINTALDHPATLSNSWQSHITVFAICHLGVTSLISAQLLLNRTPTLSIVSLAFITLCLPIASALLLLMMQFRAHQLSEATPEQDWQTLTLTTLPKSMVRQNKWHSGSDPIYTLKYAETTTRKLAALETALHLPLKQAVPIYRQAMLDDHDEVRLMGVSQFKRIEHSLNTNITQAKKRHDQASTSRARAESALIVALRYFDFIYLQVADNALRPYYLSQAEQYCQQALASESLPEANLLAARLALLTHDDTRAQTHLEALEDLAFPPQQVNTYLAESAFNQGHYERVSDLMQHFTSQSPTLEKVRRFWL